MSTLLMMEFNKCTIPHKQVAFNRLKQAFNDLFVQSLMNVNRNYRIPEVSGTREVKGKNRKISSLFISFIVNMLHFIYIS